MNASFWELVQTVLKVGFVFTISSERYTRAESNEFVHRILDVIVQLLIGKGGYHHCCALRKPNVKDFPHTCHFLDTTDHGR